MRGEGAPLPLTPYAVPHRSKDLDVDVPSRPLPHVVQELAQRNQDLVQVPVQGAGLIVLNLPPEEVFFRFTLHREWDVSEMSMGSYVSMRSQDDKSIRRRSMARFEDITASYAPFAWLRPYSDRMKALFGQDFWPYGVAKNRTTLEAFLGFACEQGVCHRRLPAEELFSKQTLTSYKV